ncbi:MAG: kelch repeat-containing protein, partial [Bacteroidia bacterium]
PGGGRDGGLSFSIGSKGYIGGGFDGQNVHDDMYEYDPSQNKWTLLDPFPGGAVIFPASFVINGKAYVGTGDQGGVEIRQFWEYDPIAASWTRKADFAGDLRQTAIGFSIGNKGYIGGGMSGYTTNRTDFWEYDVQTNSWTKVADTDLSDAHTAWSTGFVLGNTMYYGLGVKFPEFSFSKKFYKKTFSGPSALERNEGIPGFSVYPNPAKESVHIHGEGMVILRITLYDSKGQALNSWEGEHLDINTAGVLPGVYFLNVETDKGILREKIILSQ